ncbi:slit homolog 2 protein-like [Lethenteron reissneri]|uniref:slit homolog 2 protein-like n=1 Tax=Lethenteron reissneri TaxID=7753 RepID=UPI002AB67742|nr:slit homolog 2 protein-like [Lethenteron reissneri]
MWIKWIATLVAFGALVQSAVACPAQCSCSGTTVHCHERSLASVPAGIPTNVQILSFFNNQITKLEPGVFDIPAGVFNSLTQLTILDLNRNQLQALPAGVFDRLGSLQRFDLSNNQLKSVPRGVVFDHLVKLQELYLNTNQLSALPTGVFDKLTQLTILSLRENKLTALPAGVFDKLTQLTELSLRDNQLKSIPRGKHWLVKARQESAPGRLDDMTSWMEVRSLSAILSSCACSLGLCLSRWLEPNSS